MRLRETAPWLAVLALALACFFAWRWLSAAMFSRNPQFELRRVEISPGYAKSEQEIRDITGLREGVNLFSFRASEVRERLLRTHMELQTTKGILLANDLAEVNEVVLLHLSSRHSDERLFKAEVEAACGKPSHIAAAGLTLNFNQMPY